MADPQALAWFPGVEQIESCTATLSHGITPGQIALRVAPQETMIQTTGNLVITFGSETITLYDCQADSASYSYDQSGFIVALSILDRRWKWNFGEISGSYNLRTKDNKIIKDKEKNQAAVGDAIADCERTPQELAELCLKAMGESGYDVSDLPNDSRPTREWEGANPAQELASLCEELGCRVVLQLDNNVAIRKTGVGEEVPSGPVEQISQSINPPESPSIIRILCGKTRYQDDYTLEAVGLDKDEKVKLVDDLSYKPTGGWAKNGPYNFDSITDTKLRDLAKKTVYRWYRIKTPVTGEHGIGYEKKITRLRQILPIEDRQCVQAEVLGTKLDKQAIVYGVWYSRQAKQENTATTVTPPTTDLDKTVVQFDYEIDKEHGIVKFGDAIYKLTGSGSTQGIGFADLRLRTAISVRDPETGAWIRNRRGRIMDTSNQTEPRYVKHDELHLNFVDGEEVNSEEVDRECDYYLDALEKEYDIDHPEVVQYAGIIAINPDGALQSVTWLVDERGGTTTVSRNDDHGSPVTLPYKLRRVNEKTKQAVDKTKQMQITITQFQQGLI